MGLFNRRREREQAAQRIAALHELTALIHRTIDANNPAWHCVTCATELGHRPDCPDRDRPFPPDEDDEPYEPTIMAYLPLDWRAQADQRISDQDTRALVLDMVSQWERPGALAPGDAYLEGIEDAHSVTHAYLWGAASVSQDDAARAALIKAGVSAYEDAREYRRMRRHLYPHRRAQAIATSPDDH